jgi:hypothetical protein
MTLPDLLLRPRPWRNYSRKRSGCPGRSRNTRLGYERWTGVCWPLSTAWMVKSPGSWTRTTFLFELGGKTARLLLRRNARQHSITIVNDHPVTRRRARLYAALMVLATITNSPASASVVTLKSLIRDFRFTIPRSWFSCRRF